MWACIKSITFLAPLSFVFFMNQTAASLKPEDSSKATLGSLGKKKLEEVYKVIGHEEYLEEATRIFDLLCAPWSEYSREIKWENNRELVVAYTGSDNDAGISVYQRPMSEDKAVRIKYVAKQ